MCARVFTRDNLRRRRGGNCRRRGVVRDVIFDFIFVSILRRRRGGNIRRRGAFRDFIFDRR